MKQIYSARDPMGANTLKALLEGRGIRAEVQGEQLSPLLGKLAVVFPTVWVADEDVEAAQAVVADFEKRPPSPAEPAGDAETWVCPVCGERMGKQFSECWKCTPQKPEDTAAFAEGEAQAKAFVAKVRRVALVVLLVALAIAAYLAYRHQVRQEAVLWLKSGMRCYEEGKWDDAIEMFTKALPGDPANGDAYVWRGYALTGKGDYDAAMADFAVALERNPRAADAFLGRAYVHLKRKDYASAIADFTKAIQLEPQSQRAYLDRAGAHWDKWEPEEALSDYTSVVNLDPVSTDAFFAYLYRGQLQNNLGNLPQALADAESALRLRPSSPDALDLSARTSAEQGNTERALAQYARVIAKDPKATTTYVSRGFVYLDMDQPDKAAADCSQALALEPGDIHSLCCRGQALKRLGHQEAARADFAKAARLRAQEPADLAARAFAKAALGEFQGALDDCHAAQNRWPWDRWKDYVFACVYCMKSKTHGSDPEGEKARQADIDLALKHIEEGIKKGLGQYARLRTDPELEALHGDPRFQKLVAKP